MNAVFFTPPSAFLVLPVGAGVDQYGMPSFPTILRRIAQLWGTKRSDLEEQVRGLALCYCYVISMFD
jgi:uncharacterized protein YyaL (SSP411 family)